jgi:hypothetical protein
VPIRPFRLIEGKHLPRQDQKPELSRATTVMAWFIQYGITQGHVVSLTALVSVDLHELTVKYMTVL